MQDLLQLVRQRVSTPKLGLPVPDRAQLESAMVCARRAPDHGRLRPWRFHVLEGEALVALGELFGQAGREANPALEAAQADKLRNMPLRAPMVIVASSKVVVGHKVPVWEQHVAVGCAVQNLQLALHAQGFGCMWRTGDMAENALVKARFGLEGEDRIIGFVYVGTPLETPRLVEQAAGEGVFFGMP